VIFLTSKDEEIDGSLRMGADDFTAEPPSQRRWSASAPCAPIDTARGRGPAEGNHCAASWCSTPAAAGTWKGEVHLTVTEFVVSLAGRPGRVRTAPADGCAWRRSTSTTARSTTTSAGAPQVPRVDGEFEQIEALYGIGYRYRDA
jgi:two-component system response regulator ChvI